MRIACLQFAPELGKVKENKEKADAILAQTRLPADLDWLVLPEMAFSGYNFYSLDQIIPYLEPTTSGTSTEWAKSTARRLNCLVTVGYPELTIPNATSSEPTQAEHYNSTVTVSPAGEILANYRKSFLYYTDETWAEEGNSSSVTPNAVRPKTESGQETTTATAPGTEAVPPAPTGPSPFSLEALNAPPAATTSSTSTTALVADPPSTATNTSTVIPVPASEQPTARAEPFLTLPLPIGATRDPSALPTPVTLGICMDINPYRFVAPWNAFEFPTSMLTHASRLACVSMAWLTARPLASLEIEPEEPDLDTVAYWVERFQLLVEKSAAEGESAEPYIVILANRCGIEGGVGYAGSSAVLKIERGVVSLFERLGKSEEAVLVVDTEERPRYSLRTT